MTSKLLPGTRLNCNSHCWIHFCRLKACSCMRLLSNCVLPAVSLSMQVCHMKHPFRLIQPCITCCCMQCTAVPSCHVINSCLSGTVVCSTIEWPLQWTTYTTRPPPPCLLPYLPSTPPPRQAPVSRAHKHSLQPGTRLAQHPQHLPTSIPTSTPASAPSVHSARGRMQDREGRLAAAAWWMCLCWQTTACRMWVVWQGTRPPSASAGDMHCSGCRCGH